MITITIDLVPDGINALKMTADRVILACKFPLVNQSQEMYVFGDNEKRYAEIHGVNLDDLLYAPEDGKAKWLELAYMAIGELIRQKTYREGGEFLPGLLSYEPVEFDLKIADLVQEHKKDIQSIRLFGRRVREEINFPNFAKGLEVFSREKYGQDLALDGTFLLKEWPGYIPYDLAFRLDPQLCKPFKNALAAPPFVFGSYGEMLEVFIANKYCQRVYPEIPDMICYNGLLLYFMRPDGSIYTPCLQTKITKYQGAHIAVSEENGEEHDYTLESLKAEIKAGHVIYNRRLGLQKYPGVKD